METKILVAYASKHGSTAEIAKKIGEVIHQAGLEVDVLPVKQVRDLGAYRAFVLGSAVYMGFWQKEFVQFLKSRERDLAGRPVWLFSSGPTGEGDPLELAKGWRVPTAQQPLVDAIGPREITIFHGSLDEKKLNFFEKWIINRVAAKVGDFRDWKAIAGWSDSIAKALK